LVELDALVAIGLGLTVEELSVLYRVQFPVLRKYEHLMRFDETGQVVPRSVWRAYERGQSGAELTDYTPPFTKPDREAEMRQAYAVFAHRYEGEVA